MTKHDGYFHLLMTATVLGGFLFMGTAGESVWRNANKGVTALLVLADDPLAAVASVEG